MYTTYVMTKVTNYEAKASEHSVRIFDREVEMFDMTIAAHGFHMDKEDNKQVVNLKTTNVNVTSGNPLASLAYMCLLFMLMQGLIVGNMLADTILWMHIQDVIFQSFFLFHMKHIGPSQNSLFFIQIQHSCERKGDPDHQE